jgi:hypothetical protein
VTKLSVSDEKVAEFCLRAGVINLQPCRPVAAHDTSSCYPFNVSISNVQLEQFLDYGKFGQIPRATHFVIAVFFNFVVSISMVLLSSEFII